MAILGVRMRRECGGASVRPTSVAWSIFPLRALSLMFHTGSQALPQVPVTDMPLLGLPPSCFLPALHRELLINSLVSVRPWGTQPALLDYTRLQVGLQLAGWALLSLPNPCGLRHIPG